MPYKCTLTDSNRHFVEERINELIMLYFALNKQLLCDFVLVLMFEYIAAFVHINTEEEVHQRDIVKKLALSVDGRALINLIARMRNLVIHSPHELTSKTYRNFATYLSDEGIHDLVGFYLDSTLAVKFLNSFRERYLPRNKDAAEESNVF